MPKRKVILEDWGRISYKNAWDQQTEIQQSLVHFKRNEDKAPETLHRLVLCEHHPVITIGKSGSTDHLLINESALKMKGVDFYEINRGGDITYHGPGQIVGYPILDLDDFYTDVHKYVRMIEQVVINVLDKYGIESGREEGYTGVWLPAKDHQLKRKICAIGIHLSRWVSMHGFALNVNTDLSYFKHIVPCGIDDTDKEVTSMNKELGQNIDLTEVKTHIANEFSHLFQWEWSESKIDSTTFAKNS